MVSRVKPSRTKPVFLVKGSFPGFTAYIGTREGWTSEPARALRYADRADAERAADLMRTGGPYPPETFSVVETHLSGSAR